MKKILIILGIVLIFGSLQFASAAENEAAELGGKAIELVLSDTEGNQQSLKSLKGKLVLIDYWATW